MAPPSTALLLGRCAPSAGSSLWGDAVKAVPATTGLTIQSRNLTCTASFNDGATSRRAVAIAVGAAVSTLALGQQPALAAYGEAANVFGKYRGKTDFTPYKGAGFSLDLPAKWNPSRELREFPNVVLRYEDNFDTTSNLVVIAEPTTLSSVKDLGSPVDFVNKYNYLLGVQSFDKETASEGGFVKNATVTANILEIGEVEKDGRIYYTAGLLTRTADGDEGGKHQLFSAAVANGKLYIFKAQAGDKRWFKGAKKFVEGAQESFIVA